MMDCTRAFWDVGGLGYEITSAVCMEEGLHLLLALANFAATEEVHQPRWSQFQQSLILLVPAMLHVLHGNLVFLAHVYLSAPAFQLLQHMKVIVTGVLFRVLLHQELLLVQWIALAQLAIALAGSCHFDPATGQDRSKPELAGDWVAGVTIVLMLSVCSALAGSFLALRSVWARAGGNLWLHLYTFLLSALAFALFRSPGHGFFNGYSPIVALLVVYDSLFGFAIASIARPGGNLVKVFSASGSVLCSTLLSIGLFDWRPQSAWVASATLAACSLCLYYGDQRALYRPDLELPGLANLLGSRFHGLAVSDEAPKMV